MIACLSEWGAVQLKKAHNAVRIFLGFVCFVGGCRGDTAYAGGGELGGGGREEYGPSRGARMSLDSLLLRVLRIFRPASYSVY